MPQKKTKKTVKKVTKPKPPLKSSVNVKIGIDDLRKLTCASCAAEEKKKKPKRRKRQPTQTTTDNNNVSYVDELGRPISNEIINNRSFSQTYKPQPFSRNSSVIGTTFNESTILDKVIEKMSKLNNSNQSMNNTVLNQSTTAPTPARPAPARTNPAPSTIAPASPSIAPQSLNFNLSSPVRPVALGLMPLLASSMALNRVQQLGIDSGKASEALEEAINRIFKNSTAQERSDIIKVADIVKNTYFAELMAVPHGAPRHNKFIMRFTNEYAGIKQNAHDEAKLGYEYAKLKLGI